MIELPEALNMARQINTILPGKRIVTIVAAQTPHKLAWYYGEPAKYANLLVGKTIGQSTPYGGMIEIEAAPATILAGEGVALRFHAREESRPSRHQLLIEFEDGSALSFSVQMYGGLGCFLQGTLDNPYYRVAREKPSPFSSAFDQVYFDGILSAPGAGKLSLKALLATEQRIPGLGNGVLQDILFNAGMHPKKKIGTLNAADQEALFNSVKTTLSAMAENGGRDTELDLFGRPGQYKTILSKNTVNAPCPLCAAIIKKEAYMGGSIYYCEACQRV